MRLVNSVATFFLSLSTANAVDIGETATSCFNPPIGTAAEIDIVFDVLLGARAEAVEVSVREGWKPTEDSVKAALRAIQLCGPYRGLEGQQVTATFEPIIQREIDPFD